MGWTSDSACQLLHPSNIFKTYRHRDSQLDACLGELPTIMRLKRETCLSYFTSFAGGSHDAFCFVNHHTTLVNYSESKEWIFYPFCTVGYKSFRNSSEKFISITITPTTIIIVICSYENMWGLQTALSRSGSEGRFHLTSSNQEGAGLALAMETEYCSLLLIWFFWFWYFQFWQT